jgi:hypothetical protein
MDATDKRAAKELREAQDLDAGHGTNIVELRGFHDILASYTTDFDAIKAKMPDDRAARIWERCYALYLIWRAGGKSVGQR